MLTMKCWSCIVGVRGGGAAVGRMFATGPQSQDYACVGVSGVTRLDRVRMGLDWAGCRN